jgi:hypothetical protein
MVFCVYEIWSVLLRADLRLKVFMDMVLGRCLGLRFRKSQENRENSIMRSIMICTANHIFVILVVK